MLLGMPCAWKRSSSCSRKEHHGYRVGKVDTPVVSGVETVEGGDGDLDVFVDGGEEVQEPGGWVLCEGTVDS
jgi:hypothetical protein